MQSLPLKYKVIKTVQRIREFYDYYNGNVYCSFSGGLDSTVLVDIIRKNFGDSIPIIFINTGLEYPEILSFAKQDGVKVLHPRKTFLEVLTKYGYPLFTKEIAEIIYYSRRPFNVKSCNNAQLQLTGRVTRLSKVTKYLNIAQFLPVLISHKCCDCIKKGPAEQYVYMTGRSRIIGTRVDESSLRMTSWLQHGCNVFNESSGGVSRPLSFWTKQDILHYIKQYDIEYCPIYGDIVSDSLDDDCVQDVYDDVLTTTGVDRTGCMYCAFGAHLHKTEASRFMLLKQTHPKQYNYLMNGGEWVCNPYYDENIKHVANENGFIPWNPKKIWVPNKNGLGMKNVFDMINKLYHSEMMRY